MTNKTFNDLTATTSAASTDVVALWVVSGGVLRKITVSDLIKGFVSGGGLVATGGFTLTVPATMIAAGRNVTNTFTRTQTIDLASAENGFVIKTPSGMSSSLLPLLVQYNSVDRISFETSSTENQILLRKFDNGANGGPNLTIGRNENASTPAAGYVSLRRANDVAAYIWPDSSNILRIHTLVPTNANDTAGTVVGTQTSWHEYKRDIVENTKYKQALKRIVDTPIYDFMYIDDSMLDDEDKAPTYTGFVGYKKRDWFLTNKGKNQVPCLDTITIFGTLSMAVKQLAAENDKKDAEIAKLNDKVSKLESDYAALLARVDALEAAQSS